MFSHWQPLRIGEALQYKGKASDDRVTLAVEVYQVDLLRPVTPSFFIFLILHTTIHPQESNRDQLYAEHRLKRRPIEWLEK